MNKELREAGIRAALLSTVASKVMRDFSKMWCPQCHTRIGPGRAGRLCEGCQKDYGKKVLK